MALANRIANSTPNRVFQRGAVDPMGTKAVTRLSCYQQLAKRILITGGLLLLLGVLLDRLAVFLLPARLQVLTIAGGPTTPQETASLHAQLEILQRSSEQLVAIVSMSVQVVAVIALSLAAFSWFTNHRQYERDLATMRRETAASIDVSVAALRKDIDIGLLKQLRALHDEVAAVAKTAADVATDPVWSQLRSLQNDFYWSEYQKHDSEAFKYRNSGLGASAFAASLRALESITKVSWGKLQCGQLIDELEMAVGKLGYHPTADQLATLGRLFEHLHADMKPAIDRLQKTIASTGRQVTTDK
jgi:hypothetical protein